MVKLTREQIESLREANHMAVDRLAHLEPSLAVKAHEEQDSLCNMALEHLEMKPEYDRMKANIKEVMAMRPKTNNVTTDAFDGYENNGRNQALKEIKAILGGVMNKEKEEEDRKIEKARAANEYYESRVFNSDPYFNRYR